MRAQWVRTSRVGSAKSNPNFDPRIYGFQEFSELLNFAQDKLVVRVEPTEEHGLIVHLGAEFYPPAPEPKPEEPAVEEDEKQPETNETPALMEQPKAKRPRRTTGVKRPRKAAEGRAADSTSGPSAAYDPQETSHSLGVNHDRTHHSPRGAFTAGTVLPGRARRRFHLRLRPGAGGS